MDHLSFVFVRRSIFRLVEYLRLSEDTFLILVAMLIGITAGYASIAFRLLIVYFQDVYIGSQLAPIISLGFIPLWLKVFFGAFAGFVIGIIIYHWSSESRGAGIPEVIEAVAIGGGKIRPRVTVFKSICASITIAFGGSVGREGPIVQIGSSIGSTIGQMLGVSEARLRILVACGAASGIAATFNAPIGGVIFAIEIILGSYALSTLTPMILSSVFATVISRMYLGEYPFIEVPIYSMVSVYEIVSYIGLGILCGIISLIFLHCISVLSDLAERVPMKLYWKTALSMGLTGMMLHYVPQIYGMGYDSIAQALNGELLVHTLLLLVFVKILATAVTLAGGCSGGIFAPSLFVGALFGGAYGIAMNILMPGNTGPPGAYAIVGMGALVSGMTHGPVTAIIILFELTGDYKMVLPLMIACIIASLLASKFKKESAYTEKLKRKGVHIDRGIEATVMGSLRCTDVCRRELPVVQPNTSFHELVTKVIGRPQHQVYVIDDTGRYLGTINLEGLKYFLPDKDLDDLVLAVDVMESGITVTENTFLTEIIRKFGLYDLEEIPIIADDGSLSGIVSRQDIFRIYTLEILKKEPRGIKFLHRGLQESSHADYVELPENYQLRSLQVTGKMVKKTLRDLDIRARFKVTVIAIKSAFDDHSKEREIPTPNTVLRRYQRLIVVGQKDDLDRFQKEMKLKE